MMTDGDVSARKRTAGPPGSPSVAPSLRDRVPGHLAIAELMKAQETIPKRHFVVRVLGKTPLTPETKALYHEAVGEIHVGEALRALGSSWVVLHSVPVGNGEVDHLVIGPGGVFIITSRNHSRQAVWASQRTFMVGGIRYPDIRNMEFEMGRVERLLSTAAGRAIEVSGILAVVAPKSLTVRQQHRDVEVLSSAGVVAWLNERKVVLSHDEVVAIAAAAERTTTWHNDPESDIDVIDLARFTKLRSEVVRAWRLQLGWAIATTVIVVGVFLAVTHSILMTTLGFN